LNKSRRSLSNLVESLQNIAITILDKVINHIKDKLPELTLCSREGAQVFYDTLRNWKQGETTSVLTRYIEDESIVAELNDFWFRGLHADEDNYDCTGIRVPNPLAALPKLRYRLAEDFGAIRVTSESVEGVFANLKRMPTNTSLPVRLRFLKSRMNASIYKFKDLSEINHLVESSARFARFRGSGGYISRQNRQRSTSIDNNSSGIGRWAENNEHNKEFPDSEIDGQEEFDEDNDYLVEQIVEMEEELKIINNENHSQNSNDNIPRFIPQCNNNNNINYNNNYDDDDDDEDRLLIIPSRHSNTSDFKLNSENESKLSSNSNIQAEAKDNNEFDLSDSRRSTGSAINRRAKPPSYSSFVCNKIDHPFPEVYELIEKKQVNVLDIINEEQLEEASNFLQAGFDVGLLDENIFDALVMEQLLMERYTCKFCLQSFSNGKLYMEHRRYCIKAHIYDDAQQTNEIQEIQEYDATVPLSKKQMRWTAEETSALKQGVARHGTRWVLILNDPVLGSILFRRTNVQLKDKWKNLQNELQENAENIFENENLGENDIASNSVDSTAGDNVRFEVDNIDSEEENIDEQDLRRKKQVRYQCPTCTRSYSTSDHLSRHVRAKHNESSSRSVCSICNKTFAYPHSLTLHIKNIHKQNNI